jgi:methionyl-tRNA synthetase
MNELETKNTGKSVEAEPAVAEAAVVVHAPAAPEPAPAPTSVAEKQATAIAASAATESVLAKAPAALTAAASVGTTAPPAQPEDKPATITIDDFAKVELRVALVKVAERVPKADKLLRLEVDLGNETRQILAGIAESYTPESLIGRKVVIVANLAPRKLRGLESNGMIVAASTADGKAVLAGFLEDVEIGAKLK